MNWSLTHQIGPLQNTISMGSFYEPSSTFFDLLQWSDITANEITRIRIEVERDFEKDLSVCTKYKQTMERSDTKRHNNYILPLLAGGLSRTAVSRFSFQTQHNSVFGDKGSNVSATIGIAVNISIVNQLQILKLNWRCCYLNLPHTGCLKPLWAATSLQHSLITLLRCFLLKSFLKRVSLYALDVLHLLQAMLHAQTIKQHIPRGSVPWSTVQ